METRVQKHKEYRASLIKEGSDTVIINDKLATSTLPLEDVIKTQNEHKVVDEFKSAKRKKLLVIVLLTVLVISIITGLIVFGILAFRR